MILFEKMYDGESLYDLERDVSETFDSAINPLMQNVPFDEHGFMKGSFKVTVEWSEDNE